MSRINIQRSHNLTIDEARAKAQEVEQKLHERYGLRTTWEGNTVHIEGKGVKGTLSLQGDKVVVDLKLGLAARMFAKKIEDSIGRSLDRALG